MIIAIILIWGLITLRLVYEGVIRGFIRVSQGKTFWEWETWEDYQIKKKK